MRPQFKLYNFTIKTLVYATFACFPIVFWPWDPIPYELPKVWFILRIIEILAILGCVSIWDTTKKPVLDKRLIAYLLGFTVIAVTSAVLGVNQLRSISGNYYRGDGLLTLFHLVGFAFLIPIYQHILKPVSLSISLIIGSCVSGCIALIQAYLQYIHVIQLGWGGPVGAQFGQPNFLAGYLLVTLPFILFLRKEKPVRYLWSAIFLIQCAAIGFTSSKAAILGILLLFGMSMAEHYTIKRNLFIVSILTAGLLLLFLGAMIEFNGQRGFVPEGRERIYRSVLGGALQRPIFGWGWANADAAFAAGIWPMKFTDDVYVDKSHNLFLEVFTTTGAIGLIVFLLIIYQTIYNLAVGHTHWQTTLFYVLFLYLFHTQTNVISVAQESIFWLILGYAISPFQHS